MFSVYFRVQALEVESASKLSQIKNVAGNSLSLLMIYQIFSLAPDWSKRIGNYICPTLNWAVSDWYHSVFKTARAAKTIWGIVFSFIWRENMLRYLSLDTICSPKLTGFLGLRSRKSVPFSQKIMCADKSEHIFTPNWGYCLYSSTMLGDI